MIPSHAELQLLHTSAASSGVFDPAGPVADEITGLWWVLAIMGIAVYVAVLAFLIAGLVRRRRDPSADPRDPDDTSRWVVLGGVVMPAIVLTVVFGLSLASSSALPDEVPDDAVVIDVIGHQWWWEIQYEDHDFATANEIHIPVDRPIAIRLTSADVIHSFWVPQLAGKLDALPDRVNTLVFTADETSRFEGRCAEFCGLQHTNMGALVIAETDEDFNEWIERQANPASVPQAGAAAEGFEVFTASGCGECHTIRGTEADGDEGPDLTHVASRSSLAAATLTNTPDHLSSWVSDPQQIKEGAKMPDIELTDGELDTLIAFLETLH